LERHGLDLTYARTVALPRLERMQKKESARAHHHDVHHIGVIDPKDAKHDFFIIRRNARGKIHSVYLNSRNLGKEEYYIRVLWFDRHHGLECEFLVNDINVLTFSILEGEAKTAHNEIFLPNLTPPRLSQAFSTFAHLFERYAEEMVDEMGTDYFDDISSETKNFLKQAFHATNQALFPDYHIRPNYRHLKLSRDSFNTVTSIEIAVDTEKLLHLTVKLLAQNNVRYMLMKRKNDVVKVKDDGSRMSAEVIDPQLTQKINKIQLNEYFHRFKSLFHKHKAILRKQIERQAPLLLDGFDIIGERLDFVFGEIKKVAKKRRNVIEID
jgi:hypothetical protein